jgi:hypothetical protein
MKSPPATRPNAFPDQAKRAAGAELSSIEVRDADGHLLRMADTGQAERLLAEGAHWAGYGSRRHLRLTVALTPNSRRTVLGTSGTANGGNLATVYHHNPACRFWPREPSTTAAGPKLPPAA